jgi:predicted Zn-dependent peptidase
VTGRRRWVGRQSWPAAVLLLLGLATPVFAQGTPAVGREAAGRLRFPELVFDPPRAQEHTLASGTPVLFLEDRSLPLVTLFATFRGGYALLPRELYAAASSLSGLLRSGGSTTLPPDSVDRILDNLALQVTFGGGGRSTFSSLNTLTRHLAPAVALWVDLLRNPGFDSAAVEVSRGRQLEAVRRRVDDPGLLAYSEFNRIMFGDHPVGWEMNEGDLTPERFSREALQEAGGRILCPGNLVLGVVGDADWSEVEPLLEEMVRGWPPCSGQLQEPPPPKMRETRRVFLIPRDLTQSTVIMAEPGGISQSSDPEYFASRIGNSILGASGFSSRLLSRLRTEMGYAYSASSLWTAPSQYEGIVGAVTQTRSGSTIAAARLILEIMEEMRHQPPSQDEVDQVVSQIANGFVFNFEDPAQIVARQMVYVAEGLPRDWLQRFLTEVQRVRPEAVRDVFRRHVDPQDMTILILGNPETFDLPPEVLGEVEIWDPGRASAPPRGEPPPRR